MRSVQSRVNGLQVAIPPDAIGVIGRFATKGGNELVFEQESNQRHVAPGKRRAGGDDGTTMQLGTSSRSGKKAKTAAGSDLV